MQDSKQKFPDIPDDDTMQGVDKKAGVGKRLPRFVLASRDNARSDANNQYDAKYDAGTMQIGVEGGSLGQRIGDG